MVAPASVLSFDLASSYIVANILQDFLVWIIFMYGCGRCMEVRDKPRVNSSVTLLFIFETNSKFQQDSRCCKHLRCTCLHSPQTTSAIGTCSTCQYSWVYVGAGQLDSRPHDYAASTLLTEPFLHSSRV